MAFWSIAWLIYWLIDFIHFPRGKRIKPPHWDHTAKALVTAVTGEHTHGTHTQTLPCMDKINTSIKQNNKKLVRDYQKQICSKSVNSKSVALPTTKREQHSHTHTLESLYRVIKKAAGTKDFAGLFKMKFDLFDFEKRFLGWEFQDIGGHVIPMITTHGNFMILFLVPSLCNCYELYDKKCCIWNPP